MKNTRIKASVAAVVLALSGCASDNVTDVQHFEKAEQFYDAENLHASVIELKNALQKNNQFYDARFLLGDVYLRVGAGESAEKEFLAAQRIGGESSMLSYKIAMALFQQRKYDEVIALEESLTTTAAESSLRARAQALLSETYLKQDDVDAARQLLDTALQDGSNQLEVGLANVRVMAAEGRYENARAELQRLVQAHPNNASVWQQQANSTFARGEFDEAVKAFNKVVDLEPARPLTRKVFNSKIGLARAYMLDEKYEQAKHITDELLKLNGKHPAVIYLASSVAYHNKDLDSALTGLLEVVEKAPSYFPAVLLLGATHFGKGNYEQANVELSRYLTEHPENMAARKLLAATSLKLNKPEVAMDVLEPALAEESDTDLLMMAGRASFQIGESDNALSYMKQAKLMSGEDTGIASELARAYLSQGSYQLAIEELKGIKGAGEQQAQAAIVIAHVQAREIDKARSLAQELLGRHQDDVDYLVLAGLVELGAGETLKARGFFEDAVIKDSSSIGALMNLARMDMQAESFDAAKRGFERVLEIDTQNTGAMFAMAQLAEQRGDIEKGAEWLEKIRSADSDILLPRIVLARYYLNSGNPRKALEIAEEAKERNMEDPGLLLLFSRIYKALDDSNSALIVNQQLVDVLPDVPGAFVELAMTELSLEMYEAAKTHFSKAISLKPDYLFAKAMLADIHIYLEEFEPALVLAENLTKEVPDLALGYRIEGLVFKERGEFERAKQAFIQALSLGETSELVMGLVDVYIELGDKVAAESTLLDRVERVPSDIPVLFRLAHFYHDGVNMRKAERYYLQLLDREPGHIEALNNLSMLLLDNNDPHRAMGYAKEVYNRDSSNIYVKDTYGWALVLSGQVNDGIKLIEDAANANQNPSIHYHYAYALNKIGNNDLAKQVLGRILGRTTDFPEHEAARELFAALE